MTQSTTISGRPDAALPLSGTERIPMDQAGPIVPATGLSVGQAYKVISVGNTDFTLLGAASNTVGLIFLATGPGPGTGTAATMATVDATTQDIANLASAAAGFTYTQAIPAAVWTINHNLGYRPSVELLDAGSQEIEGQVSHPTVNQTVIGPLNPPTAGQARLL